MTVEGKPDDLPPVARVDTEQEHTRAGLIISEAGVNDNVSHGPGKHAGCSMRIVQAKVSEADN